MKTETTSPTHFDNQWIKETLVSLGYRLFDNGDHWRTTALYRHGGNPNSVIVYKQTGVWKDYAEGEDFMPLQNLVERTVGKGDSERIFKNKVTYAGENFQESNDGLLTMEKIYSEVALTRLLPHVDFYLKRGISGELLKRTRCGYASGYEMYQRLVFPIYNQDGKIHGFSGRFCFWKEGENKPKWKHIGETKNWAYPLYCPEIPECEQQIVETRTVYLVESIGDALSMMQVGIFNVLVLFGTAKKQRVITELIRLGVEKIYICTNKDEAGDGQLAAAKLALAFSDHFDLKNIHILLPIRNDVNAMLVCKDDIVAWSKAEGISGEGLFAFFDIVSPKLKPSHLSKIKKLK